MVETTEQLNKNGNRRGMSPNSRKNLEKGREGNNHANKDYSITRIVKEKIDEPAEERWLDAHDKGKGLTWREAIALRMLRDSVGGKYSELLDRVEGKVTQPIAGEGGQPIKTEIIVSSDTAKKLTKAILNGEGT